METATITVKANSVEYGDAAENVTFELLENAAGRVVVEHGTAWALLTDLCGLESKIKETSLVTYPDEGRLMGSVTPKGAKTKTPGGVGTGGRPAHRELYDAVTAIRDRIEATRMRLWEAKKAEADAKALAAVPDGCVTVRFSHSEADGWVEVYTDGEGNTLRSPRIAGRNARVAWMTREDHEAAVSASRPAPAAETEMEPEAPVDVPAEAVAAFTRYRGDDEAAWEAEDERAWGLIRKYGDAIERQGLAAPGAAVVRAAFRSEDMPTGEGD